MNIKKKSLPGLTIVVQKYSQARAYDKILVYIPRMKLVIRLAVLFLTVGPCGKLFFALLSKNLCIYVPKIDLLV